MTKLLLLTAVIGWSTGCAGTMSKAARLQLKAELLAMHSTDQEVRRIFSEKRPEDFTPEDVALLNSTDRRNTARLKEIIRQFGWPTKRLVGQDGVNAAFMILQHADHSFQKEMLGTLERTFHRHQLSAEDYAMFVDRVLLGDGQKQRYGSQVRIANDQMLVEPIEDEMHVDERRAKLGLMPLRVYLQVLRALYKQ